jgi:hypothetical protein
MFLRVLRRLREPGRIAVKRISVRNGMRRGCLGLLLLIPLGCGPREPSPVAVTGTVNLDGKPLSEGKIFFVTLGKAPEIVDIADGHFKGRVLPGERRIEIAAYRPYQIPPEVPTSMHPLMKDGKENYLPARYHRDSTLTAEVKQTGKNVFTFDLESQ